MKRPMETMNGDPNVYQTLEILGIPYDYHPHPPAPTIEIAREFWKDIDASHCKNIFFRNHKGNRHYLVILEHSRDLAIRDLEQRLRQGKLTFASPERMQRYLGVTPGSVSPFGLIHDSEHHVHLFIDKALQSARRISFHPCLNTASLVIGFDGFEKFLNHMGNTYEYLDLY